MGGGVSSLPAEVTLAEAKELAGSRWQPAWEVKFADAKITRDEAMRCWKRAEAEAKAASASELAERLQDGATPLWIACENGHADAARLLLDQGVDINRADKYGATPLLAACTKGHVPARRATSTPCGSCWTKARRSTARRKAVRHRYSSPATTATSTRRS